jgi:hypothetical protein
MRPAEIAVAMQDLGDGFFEQLALIGCFGLAHGFVRISPALGLRSSKGRAEPTVNDSI